MVLKGLLFFNLLFIVNQLHFHIQTGIPAVAPANLLMAAVLVALAFQTDPLPLTQKPKLQRAFLLFFAALALAFLWAEIRIQRDFVEDLTYLKNAIFFPLNYFIYLRCRQDEKSTRQLIIWIMIIAAVAGLEAIREGISFGFGKYNPFHRASGPFGEDWHNANRAGVFYAMFLPIFVSLALFLRGKKLWRIAALGGCALMVGGALFTYSRQAYGIIIIGLIILLVRRSFIFAIIISVGLVAAVGFLPDSVTQRVEETKQAPSKPGGEEVDESTASRWEIWYGALEMLEENPAGVGLNRFKYAIGTYAPAHKGYDAHNFYVLTAAECGPQGLATLLYLIYSLFALAKYLRANTPRDDPETSALTLGFTVCTVCMALGGMYGSPYLEGSVMTPYWALCGLLERYIQLKQLNAKEEPQAPRQATLVEKFPLAVHINPGSR